MILGSRYQRSILILSFAEIRSIMLPGGSIFTPYHRKRMRHGIKSKITGECFRRNSKGTNPLATSARSSDAKTNRSRKRPIIKRLFANRIASKDKFPFRFIPPSKAKESTKLRKYRNSANSPKAQEARQYPMAEHSRWNREVSTVIINFAIEDKYIPDCARSSAGRFGRGIDNGKPPVCERGMPRIRKNEPTIVRPAMTHCFIRYRETSRSTISQRRSIE